MGQLQPQAQDRGTVPGGSDRALGFCPQTTKERELVAWSQYLPWELRLLLSGPGVPSFPGSRQGTCLCLSSAWGRFSLNATYVVVLRSHGGLEQALSQSSDMS